jgi:alkanesulfonate monooxygenase SsuD/methylene tetrahydromethanopterin reductase-like flavin-dependent oxidoreductase (luciferase family)
VLTYYGVLSQKLKLVIGVLIVPYRQPFQAAHAVATVDQLTGGRMVLGIGPGYMARHILERNGAVTYEGVDFSDEMFDIARATLGDLMGRVTLTKADFLDAAWPSKLSRQPGAMISTWALHDLGSEDAVASVYRRCFETLPPGGVLVNGDFIKPDGTAFEYEPGRFAIARHLELLTDAGFLNAQCLAHLQPNIDNPTAAENYACLFAVR